MKTYISSTNYMALPGLIPGVVFYGHKSVDHIIGIVSDFLEIDRIFFALKTRRRIFVEARQIAMFLIKKNTNLSLKEIGQKFGGRDHTTAIHSINKVNDLCFSDESYKQRLLQIENLL